MSVAGKLQLKSGQAVALLHVPTDLTIELPAGSTSTTAPDRADAVVVFVHDTAELDERGEPALQAARRDALAWIAYPKAGKLETDLIETGSGSISRGEGCVRSARSLSTTPGRPFGSAQAERLAAA